MVHNPSVRDSHWTSSLLFSLVQELVQFYDTGHDTFDVEKAATCVEVYNTLVRRVEELDLVSAIDAKPIIDVSTHIPLAIYARLTRVIGTRLDAITGTEAWSVDWQSLDRRGQMATSKP